MLEKTLYNQLFSRSFSLPVEVNYWDGTTKQYGDTDTPPQIKINIHEEIPMKEITSNASFGTRRSLYGSSNRDRGKYPSINQRCLSASKQLFTRKRLSKMAAKERKTYKTKKTKKISMRIMT